MPSRSLSLRPRSHQLCAIVINRIWNICELFPKTLESRINNARTLKTFTTLTHTLAYAWFSLRARDHLLWAQTHFPCSKSAVAGLLRQLTGHARICIWLFVCIKLPFNFRISTFNAIAYTHTRCVHPSHHNIMSAKRTSSWWI